MKKNKSLKIILFVLTIFILSSLAYKISIRYFASKEEKQQESKTEQLVEKGIQFNQVGQIDSSLANLYLAWEISDSLHLFEDQPKIAYFISRITYENYGYDEIKSIEYFKYKIGFRKKYEYCHEFMMLLASIYQDNYNYEEAALIYLEYAEYLYRINDTLNWNYMMAKFFAANKASGDLIISSTQLNLNYEYFLKNYPSVLEKTPTKLLISEGLDLFSVMSNKIIRELPTKEIINVSNFYSVYEDGSNLCDVAVSQGNVALSFRRTAWNEEEKSFNDTILEQSKILYRHSIANFEKGNCKGYDYMKTVISFANTYAYCDSVEMSNNILSKLDTTGMPLYLQLIYSERRARNEISLKNNSKALAILQYVDSKIVDDQWPKCYYQRVLEKKIDIKNLIRSLTGETGGNGVSNEIIDLYYEFDDIREKSQLRSVALANQKVSERIKEIFKENEENKKNTKNTKDSTIKLILFAILIFLFIFFVIYIYSMTIPSETAKKPFFVNGKVRINFGDIVMIKKEATTNYVKYHLKDGRQLTEYITIEKLINGDLKNKREPLPPSIFLKTSQSFIVNISELREILKGAEGILMSNGEIAGISPDQKEQIVKKIESHAGKNHLDFIFDEIKKDITEFYSRSFVARPKKQS